MRRVASWIVVTAAVSALLAVPAHAAQNPCRVACRMTRKVCVRAALAAFVAARTACAAAPTPADRRACKAAARTVRAAAKAACKAALHSCVGGCGHGSTTTTLPGTTCGDAEAAPLAGITTAHNDVRAHATPTPNPALSPLCYSASIAASAQSWADGCAYMHDTQRLRSLGFGENLYAAAGTRGATAAQDAVPSWACEATNYDYSSNACSLNGCSKAPGVCGHYTQIVWRATGQVGCGMKVCTSGSPFPGYPTWTYVVCDYQPPGNVSICDEHGNCVLQRPY